LSFIFTTGEYNEFRVLNKMSRKEGYGVDKKLIDEILREIGLEHIDDDETEQQ